MRVRHCLLLIPMLLLTACALGEGPSPTPPPAADCRAAAYVDLFR
jgi:hypothetical protein